MLLPKNRKVPLQPFVALLLLLAAIPQGSDGLKCYKCASNPKDSSCTSSDPESLKTFIMECEAGMGACYVSISGGDRVMRKCIPTEEGACLKKAFDKDCATKKDGSLSEIMAKEYQCKKSGKQRSSTDGNATGEFEGLMGSRQGGQGVANADFSVCVCDTDLCNLDRNPAGIAGKLTYSSGLVMFVILAVLLLPFVRGEK